MKIKKLLFQDKEYYNMILAAYSKAYKKTGTSYQLIMDGDKLSVIKKGSMLNVTLDQKERYHRELLRAVNRQHGK